MIYYFYKLLYMGCILIRNLILEGVTKLDSKEKEETYKYIKNEMLRKIFCIEREIDKKLYILLKKNKKTKSKK